MVCGMTVKRQISQERWETEHCFIECNERPVTVRDLGFVLNSHTSKDKNLKRGKKCKETLFLRRGKVYQGFYVFLEPISYQKSSLCGM